MILSGIAHWRPADHSCYTVDSLGLIVGSFGSSHFRIHTVLDQVCFYQMYVDLLLRSLWFRMCTRPWAAVSNRRTTVN